MNTEERNKIDGDLSVGHDMAVGGDAIVQGNTHLKGNVRIDGYLDATNFKYPQVGLYSDINRLYKVHPHPRDGWWAIVGDTIPGEIYVGENGIWKATGQIGGQPTIEGQPILQLISELQTALDATTSVANGALQEDKFNEKLNADEDFNKLKTRVSDTAAVAGGALQAGDLNNALLNTGAFQGISKEIQDTGANLGIAIDRITVVEGIQAGPIPVDKFENALGNSDKFKETNTAISNTNTAIAVADGKIRDIQKDIEDNVLKTIDFDTTLGNSQIFKDNNTTIANNMDVAVGTINTAIGNATNRIKDIEDNGITKGNLDANLLESQPFKDTNNAVAVAQDTADTAQETATGALSAAGAAQTLANTVSSNLATTNQNLTAAVGRISTAETNITTATNTANAAKTTADNALPSASFTQANLVSKLGTTYLKPSEFNAKLQADDTFKTAQTNITTATNTANAAKNKADTAYNTATSAGQAAVSAQETADSAQSTATEAKNALALKLDTSKAAETLEKQISINASGKWVVNGVVKGQATGAQGVQGATGAKGADGKTWKPTVATDGTLSWAQDTSTSAPTSQNIRGPQGVQGPQGLQGVAGAKGDYFLPTVDTSGNISWTKKTGSTSSSLPTTRNILGPKGDNGITWRPVTNSNGNISWSKSDATTTPTGLNFGTALMNNSTFKIVQIAANTAASALDTSKFVNVTYSLASNYTKTFQVQDTSDSTGETHVSKTCVDIVKLAQENGNYLKINTSSWDLYFDFSGYETNGGITDSIKISIIYNYVVWTHCSSFYLDNPTAFNNLTRPWNDWNILRPSAKNTLYTFTLKQLNLPFSVGSSSMVCVPAAFYIQEEKIKC